MEKLWFLEFLFNLMKFLSCGRNSDCSVIGFFVYIYLYDTLTEFYTVKDTNFLLNLMGTVNTEQQQLRMNV